QTSGTNGGDIWILPLESTPDGRLKPGSPAPFIQGPASETAPEISPDGRWLAYVSDETTRRETYVQPFPGPGGRGQISNDDGDFPTWSRTGNELFYLSRDARVMAVSYRVDGNSFVAEKPRLWSQAGILNPSMFRLFDIGPDGKRFVQLRPRAATEDARSATQLTFLLNFFDELRRRVPAGGK